MEVLWYVSHLYMRALSLTALAHKLFWELVTSFIAEPFLVLTSPIDAAALFVALPLCCFVFFYLSFLWQLFGQT